MLHAGLLRETADPSSASADTLPRLPPGITNHSGTSQSNCWMISIPTVF